MNAATPQVRQHYAQAGYAGRLLTALRAAGKDLDRLTRDDLAPFEEFHIGGRDATRELAQLAGLHANLHVLDLGSGIGGPARTLAAEFGCRVTGLDLVDEYVEAASELTRRAGLADRASFQPGDACALPFPAAHFDAVVSEHMTMNIEDKATLFVGVRRVLRVGGVYALYEICAGTGSVEYPVPWAATPTISFLRPPDELRRLIENAGFAARDWNDVTAQATQRFGVLASLVGGWHGSPPALGPHLVMGHDYAEKIGNLLRNLQQGSVRVVMAAFEPR
jgi:MPBQ/MSBQ methyltransferase